MSYKHKKLIGKVALGIIGVSFTFVEYGAYIIYIRRPFIYPGLFQGEPLNGRLVSMAMAVHALICVCTAIATGILIRKRTTADIFEAVLFAVVCAGVALTLSLVCVAMAAGLMLFLAGIVFSILPAIAYDNLFPIVLPVIGIIVAVSAYVGGHIISSTICIRTAKDSNKR